MMKAVRIRKTPQTFRNGGSLRMPLAAAAVWPGVWAYPVPWWAACLAALSLWSYLLYAWDKRAARLGKRRVAEKRLLLAALLGGWPGAWVARRQWCHKTAKQPFVRLFWCCVLLHTAGSTGLYLYWRAAAVNTDGLFL
ncbi:DUF1294 domain-containing protein [Neisseria leonii]|uniref:DUF1294 domain-containing protein n=1 Tax=Neisseria leonii TaxID=2995413 RepID=A0A9X4E0T6_9NEIS|nr:DUF1294 domain-containing protein [Neisseria sp. 51.81]MDD9326909.1 DUF1294 domain-containing protein [Neisseria sp. 51.81]